MSCQDNDILLSIVCTTYNHENYIRQALDSILMQKVNFKYEVLVGEDCSPDNTRAILKEYEEKYPDVFVMFYRDKNLGIARNFYELNMSTRGKYIAFLEGDDYWIDKNKLQTQVDYLESHSEVIAVSHRCVMVDKNGETLPGKYPECESEFFTIKEYKQGLLPGQLASIVMRNFYKNPSFDISIVNDLSIITADRVLSFICVSHGGVYCMSKVMSAYRYVVDSGTSFSAQLMGTGNEEGYLRGLNLHQKLYEYAKIANIEKKFIAVSEEQYFCSKICYLRMFRNDKKLMMKEFLQLRYKFRCLHYLLSVMIKIRLKRLKGEKV